MPPESEQWDTLRRLLALKRHEVPPPGFFDTFPERVHARILSEANRPAPGWWARLTVWRVWRPALAGACAVLAAGLWIWHSGRQPHPTPATARPLAGEPPAPGWTPSSLTPATASGPFPGTLNGLGMGLGRTLPNSAPPGLFAPGAGLRGTLTPVAATGAISGITVTGLHTPPARPR